jgi:hypothetical protein
VMRTWIFGREQSTVGDGTGGKTTSLWWAHSYLQAKEDAVRDVASTTAPADSGGWLDGGGTARDENGSDTDGYH